MSYRRSFIALVAAGSAALASAVLACGDAPNARDGSEVLRATLARIDTLVENDSLYVGRPMRATYSPTRSLLVIDVLAARVVEYDVNGHAARVIGRAGTGPGEYQGPVAVTVWGNDTLAIGDISSQSVSLHRLTTGTFIRRIISPGTAIYAVAAGTRDLAVAAYSPSSQTTAAILSPGDTALRAAFPFTATALASPLAARAWPVSFVAAQGNSVAVAVMASNEIVIGKGDDSTPETIAVPRRHRRAIPAPLDDALRAVIQSPELLTFIPAPDGLHWRDDGLLLIWHKDWIAPEGGLQGSAVTVEREATLRVFATLIDRQRNRACVDFAVPSDWAENPAYFPDGFSLVALGHALSEGASRPVLELRRYEFPLDECDWVPLEATRAPS